MAGENTTGTLNGFFKTRYAKKLRDVVPRGTILQRDIPFVGESERSGGSYHEPVLLSHEHGFTYAPSGTDAFALDAATAGQVSPATILGAQMVLRSRIGYEAAARASKSERAFGRALDVVVKNMWLSNQRRLEIDLFAGNTPVFTLATISGADGTPSVQNWAAGYAAGMETARVDVFDSTGTPIHHSTTISSVDIDTRVITFGATLSSAANNDLMYFDSQAVAGTPETHNTMLGLDKIATTTTGNLFGISTSNSLWKASSYSVTNALTFEKVNKAVVQAINRGLDEDICLYVNPNTWADLLAGDAIPASSSGDGETKYRRHPTAGGTYKVGATGIEYYSQSGTILIKPSIYVRQGDGFLLSPSLFKRIGASDITFELPDKAGYGEFFLHIPDTAGYELRTYSNQALFTAEPAKLVKLTGITPG